MNDFHSNPSVKKKNIFFVVSVSGAFYPFQFQHEVVLRNYSTEFFRVFCRTLGACHTVNNSPILLKSSLLDSALSQLSGEKNRTNLSSL